MHYIINSVAVSIYLAISVRILTSEHKSKSMYVHHFQAVKYRRKAYELNVF